MAGTLPASALTRAEALDFLYRYMPLPDSLDYSREFYERNVDLAFRAREEMPWGKDVPEREFLHFVVPVRVNNENLDNSREVFYAELKERIKGMTMKEAALEINHWAHEKVTYRPSDPRTSSPLASVSKSFGRCGEESTFGVAAMRAMGIPARQIYTPRWAHTDDNHAWVEVWVDGKWYFLGACEPEPILNLAWFNAPAARGMLMNTDAFGDYSGSEEVIEKSPFFTKINVTENYAPVATTSVKVVDADGKPASNVDVRFMLYNYAEFYPLAKKKTDSEGSASFTSGLGDLLVWASDGKNFGFKKISAGKDNDTVIEINMTPESVASFDMDIVPPVPSGHLPKPTADQVADNERRKAFEDSIRNAYMATFFTLESGAEYAEAHGYDTVRTAKILRNSYGNHGVITSFLESKTEGEKERALRLLEVMAEKDISDVTPDVLNDHFNTKAGSGELYDRYVMNPRIAFEMLTPYKSFFNTVIPEADRNRMASNPAEWIEWVKSNIATSVSKNPRSLPITPASVWQHRKDIDPHSRNIFFVAGARSMGIPARIDEVTGKVQYSADGRTWSDVAFESAAPVANNPKGTLQLNFEKVRHIDDPRYYAHFSISKIENGFPRLLEYGEEDTWSRILKSPAEYDAGQYLLVTGQRMADGTVLTHSELFEVKPDEAVALPLTLRQDESGVQVIGSFNAENLYTDLNSNVTKSLLSTTGRGYYALALISPNSEPTSHALNDISIYKDEFEKWGRPLMLLFKNKDEESRFKYSNFDKLPSTVVYGIDPEGRIAEEIATNMKLDASDTPVIIIADTFNRIVFVSNGYRINTGETLIDTIHKLKE